ncbi:MAG: hypothetical protein J2P56_06880 [Verrucomicrobia bacterium]|nr:hypothetical protein [Verrucomicrobiota bacterium]
MNPEGFFGEIRRHNVIRMAGLDLIGACLVVQVACTVLPTSYSQLKVLPFWDSPRGDPPLIKSLFFLLQNDHLPPNRAGALAKARHPARAKGIAQVEEE